MNVLFVIHTPKDPTTAVYAYVRQRGRLLEGRGHRVSVLAPEDLPWVRRRSLRWWPLVFPVAVALRCRRDRPDVAVFHSFSGWAANLLRRVDPRLRGVRTVTQFHGLEPLFHATMRRELERNGKPLSRRYRLFHEAVMPALLRASCRRSDRVFCLNSGEIDYLRRHGWSTPDRLDRVPNAVDSDFFLQRRHRPRARRLLFLGQWLDGKGIRYLVEAFAELARELPDLELRCVGTHAGAETVAEAFPAGVRERVSCVPRADRAGVLAELQEADVFVFPTLSEGFSLALLEAMAAGLPIVTTPVGAAPDLLAPEDGALFVPPSDGPALASAVRRLLDDAELRARLGDRARETARTYRWEELEDGYGELLEEIGRHRPEAAV